MTEERDECDGGSCDPYGYTMCDKHEGPTAAEVEVAREQPKSEALKQAGASNPAD